jgi:hypothetical protein
MPQTKSLGAKTYCCYDRTLSLKKMIWLKLNQRYGVTFLAAIYGRIHMACYVRAHHRIKWPDYSCVVIRADPLNTSIDMAQIL